MQAVAKPAAIVRTDMESVMRRFLICLLFSFIISTDSIVQQRRYCNQFVMMCGFACVCGCVAECLGGLSPNPQ